MLAAMPSQSKLFILVGVVPSGNLFALGLFLSPLPTFSRIKRNKSTEQFSGLPYLFALMNCLICTWYGLPIVSPDNILPLRMMFVGYLSVISLISMFASPLSIIKLVVETKSVEYMPFYLSLSTFLMSTSFFAYGILGHDFFISVPNGIGSVLGIIQLGLYFYYSRAFRRVRLAQPLLTSQP